MRSCRPVECTPYPACGIENRHRDFIWANAFMVSTELETRRGSTRVYLLLRPGKGSQRRQEDPPTVAFEVEAPFEIANVWQTSSLDRRPNLERYLSPGSRRRSVRSP